MLMPRGVIKLIDFGCAKRLYMVRVLIILYIMAVWFVVSAFHLSYLIIILPRERRMLLHQTSQVFSRFPSFVL